MIGKKLSTKIGIALAIYVIFAMILTSFVGAVDANNKSNNASGADSVSESGDVPGFTDTGEKLSDVEFPNQENMPAIVEASSDGVIMESGETVDPNVDSSIAVDEQERLAGKILGGSSAEINQISNSVAGLKVSLDDTIGQIITETLPKASDKNPGTTNLYDTVSNYLNNDRVDDAGYYVPAWILLAQEGYTADRELVEERTIDSKVFLNDDGTRTAIMNNGPLHFIDETGEWQNIDLNIVVGEDGSYMNDRNHMRTYFDFESSAVSVNVKGSDGFSWTPLEMRYMDSYGLMHSLSEAQSSIGTVKSNAIHYDDTFESTSEEYFVMNGQLKHNLILSELPQAAINGMYLSYVGQVELADGLELYVDGMLITSTIETTSSIEVRNAQGDIVYILPAPFAFEQANIEETVDGSYRIEIVDGEIYLSINTPIEWLNDAARSYPIVVDPNIIVELDFPTYGSNYGYWYQRTYRYSTSKYYSYSTQSYRQYLGGRQSGSYYYLYRDWIRWSTAVIPNTATIKQVDVKFTYWYYTYSYVDIYTNLRATNPSYPPDSYYSSQSARRAVWTSLGTGGSIYNPQVGSIQPPIKFPGTSSSPRTITVTNLAGTVNSDVKTSLTSNRFYMALHKSSEATYERYYGYFYYWYSYADRGAWLTVTYDPCPIPPKADAGGPYNWPEGTVNPTLDASNTFSCGGAWYFWDTNNDGIYGGPGDPAWTTSPTTTWFTSFPDDQATFTIGLKVVDPYGTSYSKTTVTIYNVNPKIISPATPIVGNEGSTINFPDIEFYDPGRDTWKWYYDFNGDNVIDRSGSAIIKGGKTYVPAQTWYYCDDADNVNLTVEDEDGGYSDTLQTDSFKAADYDGYVRAYYRTSEHTRYSRYWTTSSSAYTYVSYQERAPPYTSYSQYKNYERRGVFRFDTSAIPSTFKATKATLTLGYVYVSSSSDRKLGVNDINSDPSSAAYATAFNDADATNILLSGNYYTVSSSGSNKVIALDPSDFNSKFASHSSWYGIGFDRYDKTASYFYMYFRYSRDHYL
ncbi:MAG: hypothetical protein JSV49_03275, partial [Thermoplasmata archaeon]